jgi:hypothetical protein
MKIFSVLAVLVMVFATFTCVFQVGADDNYFSQPSKEAATWAPLVPMKSTYLVRYDPQSYIDDYGYMAAVPAAVFYDKDNSLVYGAPLMFWEPSRGLTAENLPQDSTSGVSYFMQDWLNYTGQELDNVQYINLNPDEIQSVNDEWGMSAKTTRAYNTDDPYVLAKEIALYNWKKSDTAVIAVIDKTFPDMDILTNSSVQGTIPGKDLEVVTIVGNKEPSAVKPNMHPFTIDPDYKFITSQMKWYGPTGSDKIASITERGKDPDLQLYDMTLGEVGASEEWNVESGVGEYIGSYIYHPGQWSSAVTYMPTKSLDSIDQVVGKDPKQLPPPQPSVSLKDLQGPTKPGSKVTYTITNTMYPGLDLELPTETPFMAKDGTFTLTWSGSDNLGLLVRGPSDAVIASDVSTNNPKTLTVKELGQGNYSVTAVRLTGGTTASNFNISYQWHQYFKPNYGDSMASASEGASMASFKNVPLLYATTKGVPKATRDALDTLGVKNVILVDLNGRSKGRVKAELTALRSWLQPKVKVHSITSYTEAYAEIKAMTKTNYLVFTTIDPWTYWAVDKGPIGEEKCGLFIGPATYAAAIHGTGVFITDVHSELSTSVAWSNAYWVDAYAGRYPPSVGAMVLTGTEVYNWLKLIHYDKAGMEYMMTVADQFDIGMSWDRTFVGAAIPGRIMGTPIDTGQWIARSAMYTAMIFANPATSPGGIVMKTGSASKFENGLIETSPEHEITAVYPVVNTWVSYQHRFNERGSLYWGADYISADGITPFETPSGNDIDLNQKWPDLTTSEIVPHYAKQAGYTPVYSSNFDDTMVNLNKGSLLWLEVMHGGNRGAGVVGFWDPAQNPGEPNPWRGYESGGSTFEPDTIMMGHNIGLDVIHNPTRSNRGHDGVVIAIIDQSFQTTTADGYQFDQAFGNLHSMGFNGGSCLIAATYMHMTMIRHGMVFQVIDPWLTSWYATFAMETWLRGMDLGDTVGQAYQEGVQHVGIQYLVEQWWWDIFENVVFYGDPALNVYMPIRAWEKPPAMPFGMMIGGHTPDGTDSHPDKIKSTTMMEYGIYAAIALGVAALVGTIAYKIKTMPPRPKKAKKGKGAGKGKDAMVSKTGSPVTTAFVAVPKVPPKAKAGNPPPDKGKAKGRWFGGTKDK